MSHVDPVLRACMAEIKQVMDRHDCGGFVSLASRTHAEYEFHLPKWSVAELVEKGTKDGHKEAAWHIKHRKANAHATDETFHLFLTVRDTCSLMVRQMQQIHDYCKDVLGIEHKVQTPDRGS